MSPGINALAARPVGMRGRELELSRSRQWVWVAAEPRKSEVADGIGAEGGD